MDKDKMDEMIVKFSAEIAEYKQKVKADEKVIFGNGKPGLIDTVAILERRISMLEADKKNIKRNIAGVLAIVAWVASAAVNLVSAWLQSGR